jgi:hypothetical protein
VYVVTSTIQYFGRACTKFEIPVPGEEITDTEPAAPASHRLPAYTTCLVSKAKPTAESIKIRFLELSSNIFYQKSIFQHKQQSVITIMATGSNSRHIASNKKKGRFVVIRFLMLIFLVVLAVRTRELVIRMGLLSQSTDQRQKVEEGALPPIITRKHTYLDSEDIQPFLSTVESLDGMSESLRVLLGVALGRHKDPEIQAYISNRHNSSSINTSIVVDMEVEEARCQRYGFTLSSPFGRRRIFWGSLLADDSWHALGLAASEFHGLFDTIAFVESNTTQSRIPRSLRFPPDSRRKELLTSPLLWGNLTRVHVDYYTEDEAFLNKKSLWRENDQRNRIFKRWKLNGMRNDDIGFLSDIDEVATRDFLLALQVCNVPEFTPSAMDRIGNLHHDCIKPKLSSSTIVYEGSPQCLQIPRRLGRPDWVIGECIQGIGDKEEHPPVPRTQRTGAMERISNWTKYVGTQKYQGDTKKNDTSSKVVNGPLWDATDFRMISSRRTAGTTSHGIPHMLPTAYHFHNFFDSLHTLRRKYLTYGHPKAGAMELPLGEIQINDLGFMVDCLTGRSTSGSKWRQPGPSDWYLMDPLYGTPIAFQKEPDYARLRHDEFRQELAQDEESHPPNVSTTASN